MTPHEPTTMAEELRDLTVDMPDSSITRVLLRNAADALDREGRYWRALTQIAALDKNEGGRAALVLAREALGERTATPTTEGGHSK